MSNEQGMSTSPSPQPPLLSANPHPKRRLWLIWCAFAALLALSGTVIIFARVASGPHTPTTLPNAHYPAVNGIPCDVGEHMVYHIHIHISLYINGSASQIPGNIGIASNRSCYYWIHVHDTSGILHIESPTQKIYTLGNFLAIWSQVFPGLHYPAQLANIHEWSVYISGKAFSGDFRNIPLTTHMLITMGYHSPDITPDSVYNWPY